MNRNEKNTHCLKNHVHGEHLCVGCGLCALVCPHDALSIKYGPEKRYQPVLNQQRCVECGLCSQYCPVQNSKLFLIANDLSMCTDPLSHGLERAKYFVGCDRDISGRQKSASGGVLTAILKALLSNNEVDAIIHAESIEAKSGEPHFSVCVSRSAEECDQRRGSFYGPLCYHDAIKLFRGQSARIAVTGVPCVIRGFKKLFDEHPDYKNNTVTLIALACSHNVTGQFVDMLAKSQDIPGRQSYQVNLRDKTAVPDANQFNCCFKTHHETLSRTNRFTNGFTRRWRSYCFSFPACHYCPDFWGADAELSVKDAWGKWASDPLGKSIVVARSPRIVKLLESHPTLDLEPLDRARARDCQKLTSEYKLRGVNDRLTRHWLASPNRRSRFYSYYVHSRLSRGVYRWSGFWTAKCVIALIGKIMDEPDPNSGARLPKQAQNNLRRKLNASIPGRRSRPVIVFGTGKMAGHIAHVLKKRILYFVDNNTKKTGTQFFGKPVRNPSALIEDRGRALIIVGSSYHLEIEKQLSEYGFVEKDDYISAHQLYSDAIKLSPEPDKRLELFKFGIRYLRTVRGTPEGQPRVLIAGGYGYGNTGDEAQLGANLKRWREISPEADLTVLSPNPQYTSQHHNVRSVPAPRVVFFEADKRTDYVHSSSRFMQEFRDVKRRLMIGAWCMRHRLPLFTVSQREADFLQILASASVLHLSGGGYLTGMTRSRLWENMLLLRLAKMLGVRSILTGHTIGVFQSDQDRKLARWGLACPELITVRDRDESIRELAEIGIAGDHIEERFDDALFCDQISSDELIPILSASGLDPDKPYVAVNTHDWGQDEPTRERLTARLAQLCDYIQTQYHLQVLFCPMVPSDENSIQQTIKCMKQPATMLNYGYDYRVVRAAIGSADFCLTLKHHPIVFAMGNSVPCIAITMDEYYRHKNAGALALFEMNEFLLHGEKLFSNNAERLIETLMMNKEMIRNTIKGKLAVYQPINSAVQNQTERNIP